jgi:signal transduction histidine kinase
VKRWSIADLAKGTLLAVLYLLVARLGLQIHAINNFATLVWPPTGLSLVAMLLMGPQFWPSIAVGAFVANLWTGASLPVALGIAAGNVLEAVLGAYLLRRIPGFRVSLDRLVDVIGLIGFAAVLSSIVSATVGVSSLVLGGIIPPDRVAMTWRAWWLGDAIGDLILAPLLLTWGFAPKKFGSSRRWWEAVVLGIFLALMSVSVFEIAQRAPGALLAPLLVWAAVRFEQQGAAGAMFLVSSIAIWATVRGHGPFGLGTIEEGTIEESLFRQQAFMALNAGTFLVLGAVTSERRRAQEEAEAANRSKDRFLAALSHELRTPLMPVLALSSLLENDLTLPAETRRQLEVVRRNTELEARLIDDLLDLTLIEKGKLRIELEPVALDEALDHVVEICREHIAAKGLALEREGPAAGTMILADAARLRQVLWNLVENAIKFTPRGGTIRLRTAALPGRVAIEVSDTGAGIDPSQMSSIFQPFRQAGRKNRGLGLGLAISSGLVEAPGGHADRVERRIGKGSNLPRRICLAPGDCAAARSCRVFPADPEAAENAPRALG